MDLIGKGWFFDTPLVNYLLLASMYAQSLVCFVYPTSIRSFKPIIHIQRGQAPPPRNDRGGRGGRGGDRRQSQRGDFQDDDLANYAPLVKTANRWQPTKDTSVMVKTEKQVKGLLNKMTKEKFDKLSAQMCDIPILSYNMLSMFIKLVYEKAISEPAFSDMYASLCYRLSQKVKKADFIKTIESDEDPSAEPGAEYNYDEGASASYRWSNDVNTTDAEVVGPFDSEADCINIAIDTESDMEAIKRGDMELTLHRLLIKRGNFMKIMKAPSNGKFYMVCFAVSQAEECGQQLSTKIFTSEIECHNDAVKMNTFKRSLLNKCEDEFNKQDIYKASRCPLVYFYLSFFLLPISYTSWIGVEKGNEGV